MISDVIEGRMDGKMPKGKKRNGMMDMIRKERTYGQMEWGALERAE